MVNYDGGAVTCRCLDSLLATDYPSDRLEIVLVDNASVDGLVWVLPERYPTVTTIVSNTNEGFARGCNLAMRDLDDVEYVALVNNDAIVDPGWLTPLLESCARPGVGAAVPKLLLNLEAGIAQIEGPVTGRVGRHPVGVGVGSIRHRGRELVDRVRFDERFWSPLDLGSDWTGVRWTRRPVASVWWPRDLVELGEPVEIDLCLPPGAVDGEWHIGEGSSRERIDFVGGRATVTVVNSVPRRIINSAGGELFEGWFGHDRGFLEPDLGQYDQLVEPFSWCGGAVVLDVEYLRSVGIFDPQFFLYYEDFDLSWRGRSMGWTYLYDPRSVVLHEHAYSSKEGSEFFNFWVDRNRRLALVKNAPFGVAVGASLGAVSTCAKDVAVHVVNHLRVRRPPSPMWVLGRGWRLWKVLNALPGAWRKRVRGRRSRSVSPRETAKWMVLR